MASLLRSRLLRVRPLATFVQTRPIHGPQKAEEFDRTPNYPPILPFKKDRVSQFVPLVLNICSLCLSTYLFLSLSVSLLVSSLCFSLSLSICLSVSLSFSISLSICLSLSLSLCLSVSLSLLVPSLCLSLCKNARYH
jgi:hypothetical protein